MRRLLSLILILLLAFGLSACADPSPEQPDTPDAPADPAPEQPDTSDAPADPSPEQPDTPDAPVLSVTVTADTATLSVEPQQGVQRYDLFVNCALAGSFMGTTYTVQDNLIAVGVNEICVRAVTDVGESPDSNTVTVGRLADPQYHATGTGVEFLWGDVPNAQGYIIYGDDGAYLTTIGLGEAYDFAYLYTADGFYLPHIQAYAEGFISSQKCGIPVMIGSNGGPIGS